jgi:hypothetical protein
MPKAQCSLPAWLPLLLLMAALCFISEPCFSQSVDEPSRNSAVRSQAPAQPLPSATMDGHNTGGNNNDRNAARNSGMVFQGRIVKSGSKLVLAATDDTTYQLDDQQKARNFLNRHVKVTGILDATTGTITINAIDPV